jgi:hypothetical protein
VDSVEELLQHVRTVPTPLEDILKLLSMRPHTQRKAGGWQDSKVLRTPPGRASGDHVKMRQTREQTEQPSFTRFTSEAMGSVPWQRDPASFSACHSSGRGGVPVAPAANPRKARPASGVSTLRRQDSLAHPARPRGDARRPGRCMPAGRTRLQQSKTQTPPAQRPRSAGG